MAPEAVGAIRHRLIGTALFVVMAATRAVASAQERAAVPPLPLPSNIVPEYPLLLFNAGIEGDVEVRLRILADGSVDTASMEVVRSDYDAMSDETLRALRQWRFTDGGDGPPSQTVVHVRFSWVDTARAVPDEPLRLDETAGFTTDSAGVHLVAPVRMPSFGLTPLPDAEALAPEVVDSIRVAALEGALRTDTGGCLVQGREREAVSRWVEERIRGRLGKVRTPPACAPGGVGRTIVVQAPTQFSGGIVQMIVTVWTVNPDNCPPDAIVCGSGNVGGSTCDALRRGGEWVTYCLDMQTRHWVSDQDPNLAVDESSR